MLKIILHHIVTPPSYYSDMFFCPVKRETILFAYSSVCVAASYWLNEISHYLQWISIGWAMVAKVMSALILTMNFIMVVMALKKRVRDWGKTDIEEGRDEWKDRHGENKKAP